MSLLDGNTTAMVYVEVETTDDYGNKVKMPSDAGVAVTGRMQPSTTEEAADLGQVTETLYRFLSRTFPGGPYARVEADGHIWEVQGTPKHYQGSPATEHYTTVLRDRGPLSDESSSSSS